MTISLGLTRRETVGPSIWRRFAQLVAKGHLIFQSQPFGCDTRLFRLRARLLSDIGKTSAEADQELLRRCCSGRPFIDPTGIDPLRAIANRPPP